MSIRRSPIPCFQIPHVLYDASDGLRGDPISFGAPTAAQSKNGTLWFVTSDGLAVLDVHRAAKGRMPPPVLIEGGARRQPGAIDVDGAEPLPPRTGHLQINYAGLSLRAPEKVRFQYLMEGFDNRWVDAGSRRQAFYTNLPPGAYRFRVKAENDGVASESEAVWAFAIAPAFYQTRWFQLLLVAVGAAAATMVWRLRVRQVRSKYSLILVERSRMAREIHDTLLQSLLGVMLRLGDVEQTVDGPADSARQQLAGCASSSSSTSARLASRLVTCVRRSCRRAISSPRCARPASGSPPAGSRSPTTRQDRPAARRRKSKSTCCALRRKRSRMRSGTPRRTTVTVNLTYTADSLALRVADDGAGFDPETLLAETDAHWGIMSMQERAAQVEGRFLLRSQPGHGTAVELLVPLRQA